MPSRPFVPVSDTVKFELLFGLEGQILQNVINVKFPTTPGVPLALDVAAAIVSWWSANIAPITSAGVTLTAIRGTDLNTSTGFSFEYTTGLPVAGSATTGQIMPANVTAAIRLTTPSRGRSYTGRLYHVGLLSGEVQGNMLTSGSVSALKIAYEALLTAIGVAGGTWGVVSYFADKVLRSSGVFTGISAITVDQNLDSQRRRLNGRGR